MQRFTVFINLFVVILLLIWTNSVSNSVGMSLGNREFIVSREKRAPPPNEGECLETENTACTGNFDCCNTMYCHSEQKVCVSNVVNKVMEGLLVVL